MKKLYTISLFLLLAVGPYQFAQSDEISTSSEEDSLQANIQSMPIERRGDENTDRADQKSRRITTSGDSMSRKIEDLPSQEKSQNLERRVVIEPSTSSRRIIIEDTAPSQTNLPVEATRPAKKGFFDRVTETAKDIKRKSIQVISPKPKSEIVVIENKSHFSSNIRPDEEAPGNVVVVQRPAEQSYRERDRRERELLLRDIELNQRENRLQDREQQLSQKERDLLNSELYNNKLRTREWINVKERDQELDYLKWREQQMNKYYWRDHHRICRYVTSYQPSMRINNKITIYDRRDGHTISYHPKRYIIIPVTKLVCYPENNRRFFVTD
jgi:hypothetical protein